MFPPLPEKKFNCEYHFRIDYFFKKDIDKQTDFNIFLKDYNCNLQRYYCWKTLQQSEYIHSILQGRHIPPITFVEYMFNYYKMDMRNYAISEENLFKFKNQIIDGKQRLLTHHRFINNEFTIEINGSDYSFKELPQDYQFRITNFEYKCLLIQFDYFGDASDDQLIELFKWCNFAGTPQDMDYMNKFKKQ